MLIGTGLRFVGFTEDTSRGVNRSRRSSMERHLSNILCAVTMQCGTRMGILYFVHSRLICRVILTQESCSDSGTSCDPCIYSTKRS